MKEMSRRLQRQLLQPASVGDIVKDIREKRDGSKYAPLMVERAVPLDDIRVRSDGTGRTVDAYAAVFMTPTEIVDTDGHYMEQNDPAAFNRSLEQNAGRIFCIYNHGRTLQGTPSDMFSVPVGVPVPDKDGRVTPYADARGLFTSTRYNPDPASDRILEAIRSGSLKGMSYTGVFLRSMPELEGPRDFWEPDANGQLTLVTRLEIALIEYGATPIPAYDTATVVGVRNRESITMTDQVRRSAAIIHHVPVSYDSTWHADEALTGMVWPASQADMDGMFAYYDERAAGAEPGEGTTGGSYPRYAGYLPHHDVGPDGKPGAANSSGVSLALARLDTLPDNFYGTTKDAVRDHLLAHIADEDASKIGVNPSSSQAAGQPAQVTASSAGRKPMATPHNGDVPYNTVGSAGRAPKKSSSTGGKKAKPVKGKVKPVMKKKASKVPVAAGTGNNGGSSSSGRHPSALGTGSPAPDSAGPQQHPVSTSRKQETMSEGDTVRMTVGERIERQSAVRARLNELDAEYMGAELPADARTEWKQLQEELIIHQKAIKDAQDRAQYLAMISESGEEGTTEGVNNGVAGYGTYNFSPGGFTETAFDRHAGRNGIATMTGSSGPAFKMNLGDAIYDLTAIRNRARSFDEVPHLYREYAMRAVERARFPNPEKSREDCQSTIERMLLNVDDASGTLARRLLVTGSPLYDRAFGKALQYMSAGGLTSEESRALQLGSDPAGGYAVPFQLDPTVILTSNGAINPLRQISRIEQIVGKEWDGVTSAGVTVTRVAEGTEAASADAVFVQPTVRTTRVQGFVPFNIELDVSWGALRSQMTSLLMDAKDVEEATAFSMGNATAPNANGVVQGTHDAGTAFTLNTATTATLAIGDLYALENQMAPRFRQQSAYLASKTTFNRFRQLFQAQASAAFDSWVRPSAGTPATFNGYPAYEQSQMGTTITSGSFIILQGDFSKFLIVDRVGMGIELIPHLFGATSRYPVGQRGILAIWFNNSKILANNAFRLLLAL